MDTKKCCHCKEDLSLARFQKNRTTLDGLQHRCKDCTRLASKACRAKRGHLWLEKTDPWKNRNDENRERSNAAHRIKRASNPEKSREEHYRWRERNPFSTAMRVAKQRAALLGVVSDLTTKQWREVVEEHNYTCHICGDPVSMKIGIPERLSLDHVIPMSRGGGNTRNNVAPAHRRCNQNRTNMLLDEFDTWLEKVFKFRSKKNGVTN
jgi:5-methylcytosine-specific restriction endonuclease McrA